MKNCFSRIQFFVTLWTLARRVPLSMGFSRHDYWNGLPCPPPRDLSDPGIKPVSLTSPALAGGFFTTNTTWEAQGAVKNTYKGRVLLPKGVRHVGSPDAMAGGHKAN